ncbi:MAG: glutathione peroxidase [Clostridiales bacterium 43-6]|nr:MAG: glutathione peroxidase [Clostridiales bacterium 43-6]
MNLYDQSVKDRKGNVVSLKEYEGKVLLIVNTATGCGFTPQYTGLQNLYDKYKDRRFVVLDFPCNQFGNQAPGTGEEIHNFCTLNYHVTFPQFAKVDVNGAAESPVFTFLKEQKNGFLGSRIKWNFTKFLIDRQGNVVGRYGPADKPENLEKDIADLL